MSPKILYVGPLKDYSGYASVARNYVRALNNVGANLVTRSLRYDNGDYSPGLLFDRLNAKSLSGSEIFIQHTTPNEMQAKPGMFNVGVFCWETDRIPQLWVDHLNQMDLVLVPCEQNLKTVRECGVFVPVEKVHYATDPASVLDRELKRPFLIPGSQESFKFLSIFQFSKKKGFDALLKGYLTEFSPRDNVCLIVKTYIGPKDSENERRKVRGMVSMVKELLRLKEYPRIHLIHEVMSHEDIKRLYATADCYVLPSRGEGWGVPYLDAMAHGLPPIGTANTGPEEFIDNSCGWLCSSNKSPVIDMPHPHDFLYTAKENWMEPHIDSLRVCMRDAYNTWRMREKNEAWNERCMNSIERANQMSWAKIGQELQDVIMSYYSEWKKYGSSSN